MFTNAQRQVERTGRSGTPRDKYLQVGPIPPFLLLLPRDWCQRVLLLESILQICFLSINPFRLIERGQDLVTQFQNATDEGLQLLYTWFFYRLLCSLFSLQFSSSLSVSLGRSLDINWFQCELLYQYNLIYCSLNSICKCDALLLLLGCFIGVESTTQIGQKHLANEQ